jgi:hypothetical protein
MIAAAAVHGLRRCFIPAHVHLSGARPPGRRSAASSSRTTLSSRVTPRAGHPERGNRPGGRRDRVAQRELLLEPSGAQREESAGEDLAGADRVHFVDRRRRNPVPDAVCEEFRAFS